MAMSHARRIRYCAYACIRAQISYSTNRARARDEIDRRSMSTHGGSHCNRARARDEIDQRSMSTHGLHELVYKIKGEQK
jgi:hypothetical protein